MFQMGNDSCYNCTFDDDTNSTCVVIIHPCGVSLLYPRLYNISVAKLERDGDSAVGCVDVSHCEGKHHVAVFYFNGTRGMIEGPPLSVELPDNDIPEFYDNGKSRIKG